MNAASPRELGRYVLYDPIAAGGMATVHFARMRGAIGFSRLVAIKRLHPNFASDASYVRMFLDEARLAARLDHPNVVTTIDVVADGSEVFLVMEHILGESLEALMLEAIRGAPREGAAIPLPIVSAIVCGVLEGLHAAHEARNEAGQPLSIVHRDVSPHNILVGVDGIARVFDFGVAKAAINTQETREGVIKGKVTYMAPEQVWGAADRRADIYATGVILWELIAGRRRHAGERNDTLFLKLAKNELDPLSRLGAMRMDVPVTIDDIVATSTHPDPQYRFASARDMALAIEAAVPPAPAREVTEWIRAVAGARIDRTRAVMRRIESDVADMPGSVDAVVVAADGSRVTSTGSVVVTSSFARPQTGSVTLSPSEAVLLRASQRPTMPSGRGSTVTAALLAFTAAMLLVGLRTLVHRDAASAPASTAPELAGAGLVTATAAIATTESTATESVTAATTALPNKPSPVASGAPSSRTVAPSGVDAGHPHVASSAASAATPARVTWALPPPAAKAALPREPSSAPTRSEPSGPAATGHKPGCESPFSIGADGIRQIKPECL